MFLNLQVRITSILHVLFIFQQEEFICFSPLAEAVRKQSGSKEHF